MGSEPGMGWNWVSNLAKYCEVYVISEGEFREQAEGASKDLPIHWYWNPVSPKVRSMCWNQGDWRFYKYYRDWQKKTADIAREICKKEKIDILHQLNMIGFREPGYLWKVSQETGVPFVWGPVGGLKMFPLAYAKDGGMKMTLFNWLKNTITKWQIKHGKRVKVALYQASMLVSSIPDSYHAIKKYHQLDSVVIPETGCTNNLEKIAEEKVYDDTFEILWVGKFDFRKRLDIAIKSIAQVNNPKVRLKVFGTGSEKQLVEAKMIVDLLGISKQVMFMGNQPNKEVANAMKKADLFLFTSVSEDTSTVVLEAVSNRLPVLCFDACGMAKVIDDKVGRKVPLTSPQQSVSDFAGVISELIDNRTLLQSLSNNCAARAQELSWDNKIKQMVELYHQVIKA